MTSTRILPKRLTCVNRTTTLGRLERQARSEEGLLLAVVGPQGVGKTTLGAELAHRVKQHYDVCLYYAVDASKPGRSVTAGRMAEFFLRRLGLPAPEVPADDMERFLVLGELLDGRRVLLVLDDVRDAPQIGPLLEHVPADTVILTSRNRMPSLDSSRFETLELDMFDEHSAGLLLRDIIRDRPAVDDDLVRKLHRWSGGLPLALSLAAGRLRHPDVTPADLELLFVDPPEKDRAGADAVGSMFETLDLETARDCATLALIPGTHFDPATAAAALGVDQAAARAVLRTLRDANLLLPPDDGRFGFHDMIRRFATDRALALLTGDEREAVIRRVVEHRWRQLVALDRSISGRPAPVPAGAWYSSIDRAFTGPDAVRDVFGELDREWRNLLATADEARKLPRNEIACLFPLGLWFFAFQTARHEEIIDAYDAVLAVAEDPLLRWQLLRDKAASCVGLRQDALVDECIGEAAALNYRPGMQSLYDWYGNALEARGDYDGALLQFERSRAAIGDMDDPTQQVRASALLDMHKGRVLAKQHRSGDAEPLLRKAHGYFVGRVSESANQARAGAWLGTVTANPDEASVLLSNALSGFLELGMIAQAQETCQWLANVAVSAGREDDAERYRQQARALATRLQRPRPN
ncbi:tetratricopeptide repeat protein [Amycolatopsis sp. La24]|uniref:tetratricopeptide repeat protein n=1 Tax=Amycolatopsis sp. La24 TaxID=3028304 RepID=UPI0023B1395F|nr:tetratricopeptide repeat protein [Amycolatopsis sp. La24]